MNTATWQHLFGWRTAFDHPVTVWIVTGILLALLVAPLFIHGLFRFKLIPPEQRTELLLRWKSWLWLTAAMVGPILLGAGWVMIAVAVLSWLCFHEFARATGLFREYSIMAVVMLGIFALLFANVDHYDRMFFSLAALTGGVIAVIALPENRPQGYLQRVSLGIAGFLLFGYSFGYLGLMASDARYRPLLLLVLASVELNDIFAYCTGRLFGRRKLLSNISPGKTVAGSLGALVLTTGLVFVLGKSIFAGTTMEDDFSLLKLGLLISLLGQLGDLILSAIKRDIGIKDLGVCIAGHGGWLDRFDSLVLVPAAVYHFLSYHLGPLGQDQAARIFTGGGL
jgi:phosphatidate cytidylyltransferase